MCASCPATGLKAVKMDPGQMEQVIVNMAMNAAAVMLNGGKLTLETANVTLDQELCQPLFGREGGGICDAAITGSRATGISPEAKKHIFEPFFTTKGVRAGCGLGLATSMASSNQSGGHINVL